MCGFVGFTGYKEEQREKERILQNMMNRIIHRGPDMAGAHVDEVCALGFRRLSIIDLSEAAAQPMYNEDKSVVLVFNGEIYNFQQLRQQLIQEGHVFHSETDSEVLVHGYESWGTELVKKLRGMFAFVIWDKNRDLLFGARDIFGIKPHYYCKNTDGSFLFGSEIKSFLEHPSFHKAVNANALRPYLTFQYSAGSETFFEGVYKLEPGHYYTLQNGQLNIQPYWEYDYEVDSEKSLETFVTELDEVLRSSIEAHELGDVKRGAFLSGGVDSSYITAAMMPEESFSVGFVHGEDKTFDESGYARELSEQLGIRNYTKIIDPEECFAAFPDIQYHMDEPQSNPSSVPLWFLAGLAREHVTVVLSGEGADELFAGYEWYQDTKEVKRFKKLPAGLRHLLADVVKPLPGFKGRSFLLRSSGRPEDYFVGQALVFSEREAPLYLKEEYRHGKSAFEMAAQVYDEVRGEDELTKKQHLDLRLWLPGDILLKADKMSMAHSLELRVPFLDKEVLRFAQTIPAQYKVNDIDTKYVLRQAANRLLPNEWATRKKKGFPVPIRFWLQEEKYYQLVKDYFASDYAAIFFEQDKILALLEEHYQKKKNNGRKIWTVFTFLVWYKRFFVDEK